MAIYKSHTHAPLEIDHSNSHALISWRSIAAGFMVALFTMIGLTGLGLALGGVSLDADTSARSAGIFSGIWFLASSVLSLFAGSYFAARVSKFRTARIGSAQGIVIAALFLGLFLYQTFAVIGSVGSAAGSIVGKSAEIASTGNPAITTTINNIAENALGDLNLRSDPSIVAQGVGTRLLRGDTVGAKNYLSRQAGLTPTEADARIAQMRAEVDQVVANTKEATAVALKSTGWTLFALVILGALSAVGGGALGSVNNFKKPLIREAEIPYGQRV